MKRPIQYVCTTLGGGIPFLTPRGALFLLPGKALQWVGAVVNPLVMSILFSAIVAGICGNGTAAGDSASDSEAVYRKNPFAFLSQDYFARFSRDPTAVATA